LISTFSIVIFGEILPQSVCSRHPLAIGSVSAGCTCTYSDDWKYNEKIIWKIIICFYFILVILHLSLGVMMFKKKNSLSCEERRMCVRVSV
jgi:CBS domain containing-hemolysin-like protein